jgi:hypothetical protein
MALAQTGQLGDPVIHLGVDVEMVIAGPADARGHVVVPDAEQMGGERRIVP